MSDPVVEHPTGRLHTNATIWTADDDHPTASSLLVRDGLITAIDPTPEQLTGNEQIVDHGGAFLMPGFGDVHNHHLLAGRASLVELQLDGNADLEGVLASIAAWAEKLDEGAWVVGGGWGSHLLDAVSSVEALRRLDDAAGGRAVMLRLQPRDHPGLLLAPPSEPQDCQRHCYRARRRGQHRLRLRTQLRGVGRPAISHRTRCRFDNRHHPVGQWTNVQSRASVRTVRRRSARHGRSHSRDLPRDIRIGRCRSRVLDVGCAHRSLPPQCGNSGRHLHARRFERSTCDVRSPDCTAVTPCDRVVRRRIGCGLVVLRRAQRSVDLHGPDRLGCRNIGQCHQFRAVRSHGRRYRLGTDRHLDR
ncbi:amidohydrolase family protein [Rhodococcus fascians]|nr:amidohydrolase family protein [Rhodococcus fascians]MBY4429688.1 amidohydrolase family protein [Rhodococcus fascians]